MEVIVVVIEFHVALAVEVLGDVSLSNAHTLSSQKSKFKILLLPYIRNATFSKNFVYFSVNRRPKIFFFLSQIKIRSSQIEILIFSFFVSHTYSKCENFSNFPAAPLIFSQWKSKSFIGNSSFFSQLEISTDFFFRESYVENYLRSIIILSTTS